MAEIHHGLDDVVAFKATIAEPDKEGPTLRYRGLDKELLGNSERLMNFGHRVYRAEDPRAMVPRRTTKDFDAPRYEVAEALERAHPRAEADRSADPTSAEYTGPPSRDPAAIEGWDSAWAA